MRINEKNNRLPAIADTISASKAWKQPEQALQHYESLAKRLWLPPKLASMASDVFRVVEKRQTAWGSISAPYGFGKTAATIALWSQAREEGFVAVPPLSCSNFDDLARGIAALAVIQYPKCKKGVRDLFGQIWLGGLDQMVPADASKYEPSPRKLKAMLRDKVINGHFALDGGSHRLVEFLARLSDFVSQWSKGLIVIIDELQQMLGPLDARAIVRFREFVWGIRTEQTPCGVILSLDSFLEGRLASWAADVLHRIREHGLALQLAEVYDKDFPAWLWSKASTKNGRTPAVARDAITEGVLLSLGQLVERPDLSNGPRSVVDVFHRADEHFARTRIAYSVCDLAEDVHQGRFRYFGEGAPMRRMLTRLLSDDWIIRDPNREKMVRLLSVFPAGCPSHVLTAHFPDAETLEGARRDLFGPLLVEVPGGLALEQLQHVRRTTTNLEQVLARCWEHLPALDSLAPHMAEIVGRVLIPRLFGPRSSTQQQWKHIPDQSRTALTGWAVYRGSFDERYPQRDMALWIAEKAPDVWPDDCDLCMALVCDGRAEVTVRPLMSFPVKGRTECVLFSLPLFKPLDGFVPAEIGRFRKYVAPEPLRPASILSAVHELEGVLVHLHGDEPNWGGSGARRIRGFIDVALGFLSGELLQGAVEVGLGKPITLRGEELLRALFSATCRSRYPEYQTFLRTPKSLELLGKYRAALKRPYLNERQRQGSEEVSMPKAEMFASLFDEPSTAAGDSLLKAYGPLILSFGDAKQFKVRFALHPAETALMAYLRKLKTKYPVPRDAASEFLRHMGYLETEAQQAIELLTAREHIGTDERGYLLLISNESAFRDLLTEKLSALESDVRLLQLETADAGAPTNLRDLQAAITRIQQSLDERLREIEQELAHSVELHRSLIGNVVAASVPNSWPQSELTIHLQGISSVLHKAREDLLQRLRSDLKSAEKLKEAFSGIASAARWLRIRSSLATRYDKLGTRVNQFNDRITALSKWEPLLHELQSTRLLCDRVVKTDAGVCLALDQVIDKYRERFATELWEPLFEAAEFRRELLSVQLGVQSLLFRHLENYLSEQRTLVTRFGHLLGHSPPAFTLPKQKSATAGGIEAVYQRLYQWTREGFETAISQCRRRKESGVEWRDPQKRTTWKEVSAGVDDSLKRMTFRATDFSQLLDVAEKIEKMSSGFAAVNAKCKTRSVRLFDDPTAPPDFDELQRLFAAGKIAIQVDRRVSRA